MQNRKAVSHGWHGILVSRRRRRLEPMLIMAGQLWKFRSFANKIPRNVVLVAIHLSWALFLPLTAGNYKINIDKRSTRLYGMNLGKEQVLSVVSPRRDTISLLSTATTFQYSINAIGGLMRPLSSWCQFKNGKLQLLMSFGPAVACTCTLGAEAAEAAAAAPEDT